MGILLRKIPFIIELLFNGCFILFYSLSNYSHSRMPFNWRYENIEFYLNIMGRGVPVVLLTIILMNYFKSESLEIFFRRYVFSLIIFVAITITWGDLEFCFWLSSVHILSSVLSLYEDDFKKIKVENESFSKIFKLSQAQIVLISFALWIVAGTLLLMLPISSAVSGKTLNWVDALFMATSASCVGGLHTISIGNQLSFFGQMVILVLIQIGGLGIMILYASMIILAGRSMQVKERVVMQDLFDSSSWEDIMVMVIDIVKYTCVIELWGGIILTIGFAWEGFEFGKALYYGFFHSISAFCNAGFSIFDNSLQDFATTPVIHGTVSVLIILGGLGFVVLKDLWNAFIYHLPLNRIRMHTKMVLTATGVLILCGTLVIFFGEFLYALDNYTLWEKLQVAFFQAVATRTAGFSTLSIGNLQAYTIYAMGIFMFIGAGSGSTGGGVKVSTFAVLFQSIKSILNGRNQVEAFDRSIPNFVVVKATALVFISATIVAVAMFVLLKIEPKQTFLSLYFEVLSAFGTVGLSTGITSHLSILGKIAISLVMYVGRVGPLTLILAVGQQNRTHEAVEYPEGRIMIG